MEATIKLEKLSTAKLTKKLAFMLIDGQTDNPLFPIYLAEAKKRLGLTEK